MNSCHALNVAALVNYAHPFIEKHQNKSETLCRMHVHKSLAKV